MSGYLLFKSLHLIAVISWMAGLLYLPRIFVYHVENFEKDQATEIFETMERKLYNYIMRPAMILSWLFGIILIYIVWRGTVFIEMELLSNIIGGFMSVGIIALIVIAILFSIGREDLFTTVIITIYRIFTIYFITPIIISYSFFNIKISSEIL